MEKRKFSGKIILKLTGAFIINHIGEKKRGLYDVKI